MKKTIKTSLMGGMLCIAFLNTGLSWSGPVNINSADAPTLAKELTGIGKKKAQAIIDYRLKNGPFTQINDLANVKGISAKTIEKNKADLNL